MNSLLNKGHNSRNNFWNISQKLIRYYPLLINFANSLDPDEADVFLKEFFKQVDLKKISRRQKSMKNYPVGKELKTVDSRTPDQDLYCFYPCKIILSYIPIPAPWKGKKQTAAHCQEVYP